MSAGSDIKLSAGKKKSSYSVLKREREGENKISICWLNGSFFFHQHDSDNLTMTCEKGKNSKNIVSSFKCSAAV